MGKKHHYAWFPIDLVAPDVLLNKRRFYGSMVFPPKTLSPKVVVRVVTVPIQNGGLKVIWSHADAVILLEQPAVVPFLRWCQVVEVIQDVFHRGFAWLPSGHPASLPDVTDGCNYSHHYRRIHAPRKVMNPATNTTTGRQPTTGCLRPLSPAATVAFAVFLASKPPVPFARPKAVQA